MTYLHDEGPGPLHSDICCLLSFIALAMEPPVDNLSELKSAIRYWTILTSAERLNLLAILDLSGQMKQAQEFNVVIAVVLGHLLSIGFVRVIAFHFSVETTVAY